MERIHVSVRARPLSAEDAKSSPWCISGNSIFIPNQPTKFEFDRIYGEDCETQDVYNARTRDIVAAAVSGFNGTVFAYGQTSSGKTHTMRGSVSEPGVIPLAVHDLFYIIQQEMDREFLLRMSYMEIYNEEVNDLLAPEHRKLQIHESIERGIFVAGLREEIVVSPDQILQLMEFGEFSSITGQVSLHSFLRRKRDFKNIQLAVDHTIVYFFDVCAHRHVGETNMNVHSSRSHTIFRMIIESKEKSDDTQAEFSCDAVRVSVLNLVDLAGSERAAKTGAEGVRLKEGSHINKSLMTLGTVIKKLSEGAESQGGHVPYRDSKLTRILQSALGGNSNTAIICNITLAQIHADETKSSLQFASRALRVTNFAHVNEILTDAALLKRQKKEIEELRAKLQGLQSEHLEEEILNLRNTLLQSELERERMALELEEEKRAQAERERRLQEQAKKIENLSSMVFCANREEACDVYKKAKRRDTWCPGNIGRKKLKEMSSTVKDKTSEVKSTRADHRMGPLLPFKELVNEANSWSDLEGFTLPPPQTLLHVASRRKVTPKKRSSPKESNDTFEMQTEYENLLLEFETQRIMSEIQIDCLMRKIAEADLIEKCQDRTSRNTDSVFCSDRNTSSRDLDGILVIKKLQEKIAILETEKLSSQQNLDCVFDLATEQTKSAQEKYEKLYEEFILAREEVTKANDNLASAQSSMNEADWLTSLLTEAKEMKVEFEHSRHLIGSLSSVVDELLHFSSMIPDMMLDLRPSASQSLAQIDSIVSCHKKLQSFLRNEVRVLEDEKLVLYNQTSDHRNRIEELSLEVENSANALMELNEEHEAEKSEFICELQLLQKEMSSLSSCSLAKEKENIRKELEKTKMKLKDTEFKLKNVVQEKTKLEGEKSCAERELKRLQSQKAMIERDMSKRESIIARRHDSTVDRSLNVFDQKRAKGSAPLSELEEEYKQLEVLAFEMETKIASLEDELATANGDKDAAHSRAESLASDLQALSDELYLSNSELSKLKEEVSILRTSLEESRFHAQKMASSLRSLSEEKEELSMQLTDALLSMEEDKAIWQSNERASMEAIGVKEKTYTAEIASLSKKLSEVKNELKICRKNCQDLEEQTRRLEENAASEKQCRCFKEKPSEANLCTNVHASDDVQGKGSSDTESPQKSQKTCEEIEILQLELSVLRKERQNLLAQVQELEGRQPVPIDDSLVLKLKHELEQKSDRLASMEYKMRNDKMNDSKEKAKLRMRLRGAQSKLDVFRDRYKESVIESEYMNQKFEEASAKLKKQLAEYGTQVLGLKKQLAVLKAQ